MLTRKHLVVLRAALRYFDDELVPHGMDALRPYLDKTLEDAITSVEVQELQRFLREVTLRYAVVNSLEKPPIPATLYPAIDEAMAAISEPLQRLAVVLIPLQS